VAPRGQLATHAVQLHRWRHNLPTQGGGFLGRERELAEIAELLRRGDVRLLTLTGVGGTGKTRLAVTAAGEWLDAGSGEACFVDLSPVADASAVPSAIAAALGVRETPGVPPRDALERVLRERLVLLVLDNFEHVLDAAPEVAALLGSCPRLTVLATSREPLCLRAEREYAVAPLAVPGHGPGVGVDPAELLGWSAVALFMDRARAVSPYLMLTTRNAAAVVDICARLDGLPLAIELAAAQSRVLEPVALRERLIAQADLLTSRQYDVPARHRTLAQAIRWSYELLQPAEQALFRRLGAFAGGWTIEAADAVAADDALSALGGLSALAAKNLIQVVEQPGSGRRFRLLETMRAFAVDELARSPELDAVHRRHAAYYLDLAERGEAGMIGSDQGRWLPELEPELDNFRAAMRWCLDHELGEWAIRFGSALTVYWYPRGYFEEGAAWLLEALGAPGADRPTPWRVRALCRTAGLLLFRGEVAQASVHALAAQALARTIGDPDSLGQALHVSGLVALGQAEWSAARGLFTEALVLFRALGDWWWEGWSLDGLALADLQLRKLEDALWSATEALRVRRAGGDLWGTAESLERLGQVHAMRGAPELARPPLVESVQQRDAVGDRRGMARGLEALALVDIGRGAVVHGVRLLGAAEALRASLGSPLLTPEVQPHAQALAAAQEAMPGPAFDAAWQAGSRLTVAAMLDLAAAASSDATPAVDEPDIPLSTRECEIAALIGRGLTSREIADTLVIAVRTADTHADHIRDKLGLKSRAEIAVWAERHGLTSTV